MKRHNFGQEFRKLSGPLKVEEISGVAYVNGLNMEQIEEIRLCLDKEVHKHRVKQVVEPVREPRREVSTPKVPPERKRD